MGGFAIFEGDDMHHVVVAEEIGDLLKNGEIRITEKEIRDKGRGDALSKGLILIQTTWFILQCIARKVVHLPITELELVTLAFAALNFVTYALWWYKPLNVECPVRVYRPGKKGKGEGEFSSGTGGTRDAEAGKRQEEEAGKQKEAGKSTEASESTWGKPGVWSPRISKQLQLRYPPRYARRWPKFGTHCGTMCTNCGTMCMTIDGTSSGTHW
jgi:hypothetical protein